MRRSSNVNGQLSTDQAVAELLESKEENQHLRRMAQVQHDQAVAKLLETKDEHEDQLSALLARHDEAKLMSSRGGSAEWYRLATIDEDVSDDDKVRALFQHRQQGNATLQIQQCIRIENERLKAFNPKPGNRPTLIFHGTPERNVGNIMVQGLLMEHCGRCGGIFGAMNPQTSLGYAQKEGDQRCFMAICVYDLPLGGAEPQPGAAYSVPTDDAATVLWLLKVA